MIVDVGTRLRDYEVVAHLKPGGMATLFLARRVGPSGFTRPVVIKVVHPHLAAQPEFVQMFLDEARLSASIHHPNVVHVEELGEAAGTYFLAMEYVPGESVSALISALVAAGRRLEPRLAMWIAGCAAAGLHAAHETRDADGTRLGIIHRDVSPQNLLVSIDGHLKVIDFGIAKSRAASTQTETGTLKGKLAYMSPEQARGERTDRRTDVYALGVVLWEMLTMRRLFVGNEAEVLDAVRTPSFVAPSSLVANVAAYDAIVARALAADPVDRFASALELQQAIARVVPEASDAASELAHIVREMLGVRIEERRRQVLTASDVATVAYAAKTESTSSATLASKPSATVAANTTANTTPQAEPSTRRTRDAERRQLTLMSCELDAGPLADTLDPEDLHRLLHEYRDVCSTVSHRFGGELVQMVGDGLVVCFGYPIAYEDAAARAVRAALAMLDDVAVLRRQAERGNALSLRVAIHTGPAVAGGLAGKTPNPGESVSIVGEARSVAVALTSGADAGSAVISGPTRRMVEGLFDCEPSGQCSVKGLTKPVEVHRVLREREARSRVDIRATRPGALTPLVGRDREVGLLFDRWEHVKEHNGQVAMLVGEPGIGKSRLTYVLRQHVQAEHDAGEPRTIIEWRSSPLHRNSSLHPAIDFFERRVLRVQRGEPADAKLARLEQHLTQLAMPPENLPLFAALLSLPLAAHHAALQLTPEKLRQKTLEALTEWVRRRTEAMPVLLIVEDLHWSDASTMELLDMLIAQCAAEQLFLVLTSRPELEWSDSRVTQVPLQRLSKRQISEMLQGRTSAKPLPPEVAEQVAARSDGVPLFIEECTNALLETGLLEERDGRYVLTNELPRDAIPATLQDLLLARLDRLGDAKELAQLGATIGREFSHELLQAVSTLDALTLDQQLGKLLQAEVVYKKGRPPHYNYLFKHALIQDAAYGTLIKSKRQQHHRRIAEVLEARFPETASATPELVAEHFTEADLPERAVPYWERAALLCRDRSANLEVIAHLTHALSLIESLDESPERDAQELRLQLPLGIAYLSAKGYAAPEGGPVFARARMLAERIGEKPQLFAVMWGKWAWHVVRGDFRLCTELAAEAMELAEQLGDPGITMEALFMPGLTMLYRGDFEGVRDRCERALRRFDDATRCALWAGHTGQNSSCTHRCYLALALFHLGFPDQALATMREAIARSREARHPYTVCYTLHHAGWLFQQCRLGAECEAVAIEEIEIAAEHAFALWGVTGRLYRAAGWLQQGRVAEALPELEQGVANYRASGAELALPFYLSVLADAQQRSGLTKESLETIAEALRVADKNDDRIHLAELHRQRAAVLLSLSPDRATESEAESVLRTSLDIARSDNGRAWQLRTTMSLARLWHAQGHTTRARDAMAEIYETYVEGHATPDLLDARALLNELSAAQLPRSST